MTFGELKVKIRALVKSDALKAVTLHDKGIKEYVKGYNRAIADILALIEQMKKGSDGKK